jgi:Protein of unknown function (DUF1403)
VVAQRPDAEILALWLADAVLAARLKWPRPLPLIAGALVHPPLRSGGHRPYPGDANWTRSCCVAYGRAAAQACDLFAELGRSSQKLIAVAPRLRARGAGAVIETLLDEDAVRPSARILGNGKAMHFRQGARFAHAAPSHLSGETSWNIRSKSFLSLSLLAPLRRHQLSPGRS